jgi:hypothetical protein
MVASTNDPWMTVEKAETWAERWGSDFVNAGALGHINAESGLGDWRFGQRLLQVLAQRASNLTTEKKNELTPWRYRAGLRTGLQTAMT